MSCQKCDVEKNERYWITLYIAHLNGLRADFGLTTVALMDTVAAPCPQPMHESDGNDDRSRLFFFVVPKM